jgi:Tol biopolymer transport system component
MAFSSRRSGNLDLWLVGVESGELKQLTDSPASDYEPRWHPDGRSIVFTSDRDRKQDIFTVDLETRAVTQQTRTDGIADYPSFSHDGKEIVFTGGPFGRNPNREVFVKNLATGVVRQVTEGHRLVGSTSFAPDGKRIVYHAYYQSYGSEKSDVWVVDAAGGKGTNITRAPETWDYKPVWSFDGEWITFSSKRGTPNFNVFVMRPDGSGLRAITDQRGPDFRWPNFTRDGRIGWHSTEAQQGRIAAVDVATGSVTDVVTSRSFIDCLLPSPDGRQLLYADGSSIRVLDAADPAKPRVLARGREPQWSADGAWVTYLGNRDGALQRVPAAGGEAEAVTERPAAAAAARAAAPDGSSTVTAAGGALVLQGADGATRKLADDGQAKASPVWSPDGRRIFFCQSQDGAVRYYVTLKPVVGA